MESPAYTHWSTARPYLTLGIFVFALVFINAYTDLHDTLRYDRASFFQNPEQAVGHALIHLNAQHLSLNLAGLIALFALFGAAFQTYSWLLALFVSAISSALGLYFFSPLTEWCVGLSGALHGLAVYAILRSRAHPLWLVLLVAKILVEQIDPAPLQLLSSMTTQFIEGNVVVDAHLWGAAGGFLYFSITRAYSTIRVIIEIND